MHGSLALKSGLLYVGTHARTGSVRVYDFDGQPLGEGFRFAGADGGPASIAALAIDADHRLWIADPDAGRVRTFTVFGREIGGLAGRDPPAADARGHFGRLAAVACTGIEAEARVLVASAGRRRHAVHVFDRQGTLLESLRPDGDPKGRFRGVARVAVRGRLVFVCEPAAGSVQVFRDQAFHFLFRAPGGARDAGFEPRAIAPLSDGRLVLAHGGASSGLCVLDAGGRWLRVLAEAGTETASVLEPSDVVADEGAHDGATRIAVIDCDGDRVQVFTLDGRCYGAFVGLSGPVGR